MKANEAPEKLYFGESDKGIIDIYSTKESDNEVEYTRTDAFINKAVFRINRNEVGDCTLELRRHILWVFPYWLSLFTCPIHFLECLDFVKAWCCERNIGTAVIYDPQGANPKMTIKYRRYKGEKLNKV